MSTHFCFPSLPLIIEVHGHAWLDRHGMSAQSVSTQYRILVVFFMVTEIFLLFVKSKNRQVSLGTDSNHYL